MIFMIETKNPSVEWDEESLGRYLTSEQGWMCPLKIQKLKVFEEDDDEYSVRKQIKESGEEFFESFDNIYLQNLAGELMSLNEKRVEWEREKYGYESIGAEMILEEGFLDTQKEWLRKLEEIVEKTQKEDKNDTA